MFTLRCTRKLLARLGSSPVVDEFSPTTLLGDWYANLLHRPGGQVVLFVNERSLLPVLVPAAPAARLVSRFQAAAADTLLRLGVPSPVVDRERREMEQVRIGRTASRQVLGVMTDFAYLMEGYRLDPIALDDLALKLAQAPCGPIGMKRPAEVVLEMAVGVRTRLPGEAGRRTDAAEAFAPAAPVIGITRRSRPSSAQRSRPASR